MGTELDDDLEAALERGDSDWEALEGSDDDGRAPGERLDADELDDSDFDAAGARSGAAAVGRCCPLPAAIFMRRPAAFDVHAQGVQGLFNQVRRGDLVAVSASLCVDGMLRNQERGRRRREVPPALLVQLLMVNFLTYD